MHEMAHCITRRTRKITRELKNSVQFEFSWNIFATMQQRLSFKSILLYWLSHKLVASMRSVFSAAFVADQSMLHAHTTSKRDGVPLTNKVVLKRISEFSIYRYGVLPKGLFNNSSVWLSFFVRDWIRFNVLSQSASRCGSIVLKVSNSEGLGTSCDGTCEGGGSWDGTWCFDGASWVADTWGDCLSNRGWWSSGDSKLASVWVSIFNLISTWKHTCQAGRSMLTFFGWRGDGRQEHRWCVGGWFHFSRRRWRPVWFRFQVEFILNILRGNLRWGWGWFLDLIFRSTAISLKSSNSLNYFQLEFKMKMYLFKLVKLFFNLFQGI